MKGARWMPWLVTAMKDAINRRNAPGRRFLVFDPEVSEWGNPASNGHSACRERTWGSETSQYPKEHKTKTSYVPFMHYVCVNGT